MEEWRPVPGFDGYEASSLGRVQRDGGAMIPANTFKTVDPEYQGYKPRLGPIKWNIDDTALVKQDPINRYIPVVTFFLDITPLRGGKVLWGVTRTAPPVWAYEGDGDRMVKPEKKTTRTGFCFNEANARKAAIRAVYAMHRAAK